MQAYANIRTQVDIPDYEVKRIALEFIYKKCGWNKDYFIKDGKVYEDVEYATSHRWTDQEFVREATEEDFFVAGVIKILSKKEN